LLKIKLEPGENYEKQLTTFSSNLSKLFQDGKDSGILKILVYPSLDGIIAGLLMFNIAINLNVKPSFKITNLPPHKISDPTILIGFSNLNYNVSDINSFLLAISNKIDSIPISNSTYIEVDGSIGSSIYFGLKYSNIIPMKPEYAIISLASSYSSKYVDSSGKFHSLDYILLNILNKDNNLKLEMLTGLKLFRPLTMDFCHSSSITLNPLYLTFTDEDICRKQLKEANLDKALQNPIIKLDENTIKELTVMVLNQLKKYSRKEIEITDYVGGIESSSANLVLEDPREVMTVINSLIETIGVESALAMIADYENEYPQVIKYLKSNVEKASEIILSNKFVRVKSVNFAKVYVLEEDNLPLSPVANSLRSLGYIEKDALVCKSNDSILSIPAIQLEQIFGYNSINNFLQSLKGEFKDGFINIKISS
jgi:hypothetical protein